MWPLSSSTPIAEYEASDAIDEIYHDIRQTLRVTGINLLFRVLAAFPNALPTIWQALSPLVSTQAFEQASDGLRAKAVKGAASLGELGIRDAVQLGPSQSYQVDQALKLYHYINPKLLLLVSTLRLAVEDESSPADRSGSNRPMETVPRGEPQGMYPMEMVEAQPNDERVVAIFKAITEHYSLSSINSDYQTLALWPDYLAAAWERLKERSGRPVYDEVVRDLQAEARAQARNLPLPVNLTRPNFDARIADATTVREKLADFERLLPPLILNVALLALDWQPADRLAQSPFPIGEKR